MGLIAHALLVLLSETESNKAYLVYLVSVAPKKVVTRIEPKIQAKKNQPQKGDWSYILCEQ